MASAGIMRKGLHNMFLSKRRIAIFTWVDNEENELDINHQDQSSRESCLQNTVIVLDWS